MIKEVIMYTIVCDNCGKDVNKDAEYSAWNDKNYAEEVAMESDWIKENDKHYCPDCFTYDDEDSLLIKPILGDVVRQHLT